MQLLGVSIRDSVACICAHLRCLYCIFPIVFNAHEYVCACMSVCVIWKEDSQLIRD